MCTEMSCHDRDKKGRPWKMSRGYCWKFQSRNHVVLLWVIFTDETVHLKD